MVIPEELKQLKQWVCWKGITDPARPGKIKKIPVNARTGGNAQSIIRKHGAIMKQL